MPTLVFTFMPTLVLAPMLTLVLASMPALLFHLRSPIVLLFRRVPALAAVSRCEIPALMLPHLMLGPLLPLRLAPLRIFQQSLSNKPWPYVLTSPTKPLCLFLAFGTLNPDNNNGLYNPTNNNKCKRGFDTTFINSRPLAGNHDQKEIDLSFAGYRCPTAVKFNWLW